MRPEFRVHGNGLATRGGDTYHHVLILQHLFERLANSRLVVDNQDAMSHGRGEPNRIAPDGCTRISLMPAGIRTGILRVESPNAFAISLGTASRGMGKSLMRND